MTEEFILKVVGMIGVSVLSVVLATTKNEEGLFSSKFMAVVLELAALMVIFES